MPDETLMPFGKHKGLPLGDIPADYLLWLLDNVRLSAGLLAAVEEELRRQGHASPERPEPAPAPPRPKAPAGAPAPAPPTAPAPPPKRPSATDVAALVQRALRLGVHRGLVQECPACHQRMAWGRRDLRTLRLAFLMLEEAGRLEGGGTAWGHPLPGAELAQLVGRIWDSIPPHCPCRRDGGRAP